jgi:leader peptidase (prepilin peptidase)/N-methyltransferase
VLTTSDVSPWVLRVLAFVLGAVFGSFFNVAIYRWPRDMSVVTPPSHCPACNARIPGYRNVPIVSYLWQRGRAACCGAKMTPRYAIVETLTALLAVAIVERTMVAVAPRTSLLESSLVAITLFTFVGGLVIATFVDLEWMEIPDQVSLPGAAFGLATASLRESPTVVDAALGAGAGYLVVQLVFVWGYERLLGRRGMGEGDAKLLLMIGAFTGWQGALFAVLAGALQGLVFTGILTIAGVRFAAASESEDDEDDEARREDHDRNDARRDESSEPSASPKESAPLAARPRSGANGGRAAKALEEEEEESANSDGAPRNDDSTDASEADPDDVPTRDLGRLKIPYGPFLALGAVEFLFFGAVVTDWYRSLMP